MINALTYAEMLEKIRRNAEEKGIMNDFAGILLTRPDLETGINILNSLEYYHHLTGKSINFYLPGYGACWTVEYPDKKVVCEIDKMKWFFSNKEFVKFTNEMESYSKWQYTGESELLLVHIKNGILSYEDMMDFYLDNMLRDKVIYSIPFFIQQLAKLSRDTTTVDGISDALGMAKLQEMVKQGVVDKIPCGLGNIITQEKYFCVKDMRK